jgi:hypothetical protein
LVRKALADKALKAHVLVALPGDPATPLALAGDGERLADSPLLLASALAAARTAENQALTVADLAKKVARGLRQPFTAAVAGRLQAGALPPGVGCLRVKKKPYLFLLADVSAPPPPAPAPAPRAAPPPPPGPAAPAPSPADVGRLLEEAFERLDRQKGSHNLVSLVDLRREVPADRTTFDGELRRLRRAGRFSLSGAEGRHGISPEERDAAIPEDGALLLFLSRRAT